MAAPQNHQALATNALRLVHRVAHSPLGDLWLALDQRSGPPGEPVLLRYVSLASGATADMLEHVAAAAHAAMSLRSELLVPALEVLHPPLAVAYAYVEAQPLSTLQSSARARELLFPVGVSLRLTIDLLRALQAVHQSWLGWPAEVPYGGLLPASVLVSRDGRTRLCDALVASAALLQRGFELSAAELAYRAPEQVYASTAPDPSTDVFIAAILLWELLSGRRLLSGPREVVERRLLEHDLPRVRADLRPDGPLSRGLVELLDSSLSLNPNQRPPTPGALATALERCGHAVASHAEVAAFVNEIAGAQFERTATIVRMALGYATGVDDGQHAAAAPPALAAEPAKAAAPEPAAPAQPGASSSSLAAAVALALERRRASGEFPAVASPAGRRLPTALGRVAGPAPLARRAALPKGAAAARSGRAGAHLPPPTLPPLPSSPSQVPSAPQWPLPGLDGTAAAGSAEEEQTKVLRAVHEPIAARGPTAPAPPVRLAPKRALLAAMASVILLIQLWMFSLARSHEERSRAGAPRTAEPQRAAER
jgi:serine/threonine-protein kinase